MMNQGDSAFKEPPGMYSYVDEISELVQQDVQLEDIMRVSFNQKLTTTAEKVKISKVNDSSMSIRFGDCSAVGGILSDKSLLFFEENGVNNNDPSLED